MKRAKQIILISISAIILSLASCSKPSNEEVESLYAQSTELSIENEVLNLVNEYRLSKGLNDIKFDKTAYTYATSHTEYMISQGMISHDNFDLRSSNLAVEAKARFVSENVGRDFTTAEGIVKGWIESPTHKKVMEGDFEHTAVSVKADKDGILYFTQLFYK